MSDFSDDDDDFIKAYAAQAQLARAQAMAATEATQQILTQHQEQATQPAQTQQAAAKRPGESSATSILDRAKRIRTEASDETSFKAKYDAARLHSSRLYTQSKAKKKEHNQLLGEIVKLKRENGDLEKSLAMEEAEERAADSGVANISSMSRSPMSQVTKAVAKLPPPPKKTTPRKLRTPLKTVTNVSALFDQHEEQQASQSTALSDGLTRLTVKSTKPTKTKSVPNLPKFDSLEQLLDTSLMPAMAPTVEEHEEEVNENQAMDAFCFTVDFAKFKTLRANDMPSVSTHAKYADPLRGRIDPLGVGFQRRHLGHPGLVKDLTPCTYHQPEEEVMERLSQQLKNVKLNELPRSTQINVSFIDNLEGSSPPIENALWLLDHLATQFTKSELLAVGTFTHLLDVMTIVKHLIMESPFCIVEIVHNHYRVLGKLIELISRKPTDFNHQKYTILVTHILRLFSELVSQVDYFYPFPYLTAKDNEPAFIYNAIHSNVSRLIARMHTSEYNCLLTTLIEFITHYDWLLFYRIDRLVKRVLLSNSLDQSVLTVYYERQPALTRGLMAEYLSLIHADSWIYLDFFKQQLDVDEQLHVIRVLADYCKRWHPAHNSSIQYADSNDSYMRRLESLFLKYSRLLSRLIKIAYRCLISENTICPDRKRHALEMLAESVKWFPRHTPDLPKIGTPNVLTIRSTTSSLITLPNH